MSDAVLIVEDEILIGEIVKINLRLRKINCIVATTGREGIELFESQCPSVVLLDVRLPDTDGWEVCKKLKKLNPGSAIIFMTAATQAKDRELAKEAGADDFIEKPFDISELVSMVKKYRNT
ncbi:MAG TPA: response regulator [Chitinispirillaceae bacterium]|nr:response regulator [Chitinispirillaceae bacterium]